MIIKQCFANAELIFNLCIALNQTYLGLICEYLGAYTLSSVLVYSCFIGLAI